MRQLMSPTTRPRAGVAALTLVVGTGLLLTLAQLISYARFAVDDALISLRFARNLAEGHGAVFNIGERVEGFSNPLLVLIEAVAIRIDWSGLGAARIAGLAGLSIIAWLLTREALRGMKTRAARLVMLLVPSVLVLPTFGLSFYAVTGLETVVAAAMVAVMIVMAAEGKAVVSWLAVAALAWMRPEGPLFALVPCSALLYQLLRDMPAHPRQLWNRRRRFLTQHLAGLALFVTATAGMAVLRWEYYGAWVPNTALAKSSWAGGPLGLSWAWPLKGLDDLSSFFGQTWFAVALLLLPFSWPKVKHSALFWVSVTALACTIFFQKIAGGDWMLGARFCVPGIPAAGFLWVELLRPQVSKVLQTRGFVYSGAVAAAIVLLSHANIAMEFESNRDRYPNNQMTGTGLSEVGEWVDKHADPDWVLWNPALGYIGYNCGLHTIDPQGLVDRSVAQRLASDLQPKEKWAAIADYFHRVRPELAIAVGPAGGTTRSFYGISYELVHDGRNGNDAVRVFALPEIAVQINQQRIAQR